jgi:UDP-glucose 4-epimerase
MSEPKTVLVTGVGGYWGSRVAARLSVVSGLEILGIDATPPKAPIKGLDFIQADIRNPLLAELLRDERVDAICHLAFHESERPNEAAFDYNVMGTMKVFGAAAEAGVTKIVVRSSTMVYGATPGNPAFMTEERPLPTQTHIGTVRDLQEIESFCNGLRGQYPNIVLTVLRFPSIVGPTIQTPFTRFLGSRLTPFLMGFDPQMQLIHEEDVVEALALAVLLDAPGVFNVAAEGVLPLSKVMALAGKPVALPVFHLAAYWGNPLLGAAGMPVSRIWPLDLDYMRYPWVGDLTRMRTVLGFTPRYSAQAALAEFAGRKEIKRFGSETSSLAYDEERLRDTIDRRRQAREHVFEEPVPAEAEMPGDQAVIDAVAADINGGDKLIGDEVQEEVL